MFFFVKIMFYNLVKQLSWILDFLLVSVAGMAMAIDGVRRLSFPERLVVREIQIGSLKGINLIAMASNRRAMTSNLERMEYV